MIGKIGITIGCSLLVWETVFVCLNSVFFLHLQGEAQALLIPAQCTTLRAGKNCVSVLRYRLRPLNVCRKAFMFCLCSFWSTRF